MKASKRFMTCILTVLLICFLFSIDVSAQRTIVIAVDSGNWAPMKMKEADGELTGFEIDMIKAISSEAGFQVKIIEVPWEKLFDDLDAGKVDAVMASVSITDQRKEKFDFSQPYFSAEQLLVVQKALALSSLQGKTIAAFEATTGAAVLKKSKLIKKKFYPVGDTEKAFNDLAEGKIDGVICDTPLAINFCFRRDAYQGKFAIASERTVLGKPSEKEDYAIAVKKGNVDTLFLLNKGIKAVHAKDIDATLKARWIWW
ncbi:MAG: transporter substrate-binding domain-containing protein [Smithellaceae bacterium]|nr:transporter substrate-binding domain-containing protein [Smithellaceae bacterium]